MACIARNIATLVLNYMVFGTSTALGAAPDLGSACCDGLEERVAALEATAARKGNRRVSLTVSGWVNEAVFFWDDGVEHNAYVGTNDLERDRFRATGDAKIGDGWTVGYTLELGIRGANSSQFSQTSDADVNAVDLRKASWFLAGERAGKVTLGQDGTATYHLIDDADVTKTRNYSDYEASGVYIGQFQTRIDGVLSVTWRSLMAGFNNFTPGQSGRRDIVRYDTPTIAGVSGAVAWGEDDIWDAGLFWKGETKTWKAAVRGGYGKSTDPTTDGNRCASAGNGDCDWWGVGASAIHLESGLFVYAGYGSEHDFGVPSGFDDRSSTLFLQAGIERRWLDLGVTNLFVEHRRDRAGLAASSTTIDGERVLSSEIEFWNGGVIQNIDAAQMDLYMLLRHADGQASTIAGTSQLDPFDMVITGARIQF